jgi:hypothetical protein
LISLVRVSFLSRFFLKHIAKPSSKEAVILGNGPSLNEFLKASLSFLNDKSVFVVNYFARTDEYETIKPSHYVICSPEYFLNEQKAEFAEDRERTFKAIAEKTQWNMSLIVPVLAKNRSAWKKEVEKNPNIEIRYMNTTPIEGFSFFTHFLFSRNLGMPRPHNVLIPSIFLAIRLKYSKVFVTGADHSWLKEIVVDDDNEVLLSQKHFYDKQAAAQDYDRNKPTPKPMYHGVTTRKRKLHEVLEKFYISFKSYWILKDYADVRGVKIVNLTKVSYIDAFEKKELKDEK